MQKDHETPRAMIISAIAKVGLEAHDSLMAVAKAQTVFARSCVFPSAAIRFHSPPTAVKRSGAVCPTVAKAQTVLARFCVFLSVAIRFYSSATAVKSSGAVCPTLAKAQTVFAMP